ncbi:MAG: tetratricopeptide repeat protein [Candidatus Melainabacteria bacterium]|nr:tetratricopeptide repeat protein [Candidatus Melainabacteria bacterium]
MKNIVVLVVVLLSLQFVGVTAVNGKTDCKTANKYNGSDMAGEDLVLRGIALKLEHKYGQAERLFRQAVQLKETELGSNHPIVGERLCYLASALSDQGKFKQAERVYKRALVTFEGACGPHSPVVAEVLDELGTLYFVQSRFAEANRAQQRAMDIKQIICRGGVDHEWK